MTLGEKRSISPTSPSPSSRDSTFLTLRGHKTLLKVRRPNGHSDRWLSIQPFLRCISPRLWCGSCGESMLLMRMTWARVPSDAPMRAGVAQACGPVGSVILSMDRLDNSF
ncbi:unnamed protein product [Protopolystoma xenopodis]|uniref:Uncharacterized protein n=1 Tax=Protopolystoma xenopodis TaxID=117903 RepID=A0A448WCZ6_9PLAT|nr:unnamed protein product [Protopolystoma xenopodis]